MARSTYNSIIRIIHVIPGGTYWDSLKVVYVVGAGCRQNTKLLRSCCESGRWRLWPLALAQAALFWPETAASLCACRVAERCASQGGAGTRAALSPTSRCVPGFSSLQRCRLSICVALLVFKTILLSLRACQRMNVLFYGPFSERAGVIAVQSDTAAHEHPSATGHSPTQGTITQP